MKKVFLCLTVIFVMLLVACADNVNNGDNIETMADSVTSEKYVESTDEAQISDVTTEKVEETTEKIKDPAVFYDVTFEGGTIASGTGAPGSNNARFRIAEMLPVKEIEGITVEKGYCIGWLAYSGDNQYLGNGSNNYPKLPAGGVWLTDGEDIDVNDILAWNNKVEYIRIVVKRVDGANIELDADSAASDIKVYVSGYEKVETVYEYKYPGESLGTSNIVSCNKVASLKGLQDGDAYGGYFFAMSSEGSCRVYNLNGYRSVATFTLDKSNVFKPHSNSACFGPYKYDESDEFPLLYCNLYNNYGIEEEELYGTCGVYRITRKGNKFSSKLVQVIKIGFCDDQTLWSSPNGDVRPYGNFALDNERNKLFTMRDGDKSTRIFEFDVPTLDMGELDSTLGVKTVTLTKEDILSNFRIGYSNYIQGCVCYNGKLYSVEGKTSSSANRAAMKIVDLERKKIITQISLYDMGLEIEPEAVFVVDGEIYYAEVNGNVYKFTFH